MTISLEEVRALGERFHHVVGSEKGDGDAQAAFFLHPEPRIIVAHGEDISMDGNWTIHQRIVDERITWLEPWDLCQLSDEPERARATGAVLWEGRSLDDEAGLMRVVVGEDWIVQRQADGDLRFALYINTSHRVLPGSSTMDIHPDS